MASARSYDNEDRDKARGWSSGAGGYTVRDTWTQKEEVYEYMAKDVTQNLSVSRLRSVKKERISHKLKLVHRVCGTKILSSRNA